MAVHPGAVRSEAAEGGPTPDRTSWHTLSIDRVSQDLSSDAETGLTEAEIARRTAEHGLNTLAEAAPVPAWKKLLAQFASLVIWILIAGAVIAGLLGEWIDTAAILAIVLLNGLIGFVQEERAGRALAALRSLSSPSAKVVRGGLLRSVPARDLVPGDRIELEAGDNVPADARLTAGFALRAAEAALTGESVPAAKDPSAVLDGAAPLGDRRNMVYMGTMIAAGKGSAVVVATGMETELGRIAGLLQAATNEPTPLQRRLAELGRVLVMLCLVIVAVIFTLQLARGGRLLEVLLVAVSLAVAAVPEGLPAVVTLALAIGLRRMAKRNALIRKLPSVETLGSVTVICSDKTGTLTRNEMTVREIEAGGHLYQISGAGYAPHGQFFGHGPAAAEASPVTPNAEPDLVPLLTAAVRCNHATVSPSADGRTWQVVGDPTEGALVAAALKAGLEADSRQRILHEIPFDSGRKAMSVVIANDNDVPVMYTKGAPEVVLAKCVAERRDGSIVPLTDGGRGRIMASNAEMAGRALRVLAFACREFPKPPGSLRPEGDDPWVERDLVFAGLVGMIDPPREEAKVAVRRCRAAGITPVMITGDHPATALAIARELGIAGDTDRAIAGTDLDRLSDESLQAQVDRITVYARVTAEHKMRIVRAWKQRGQIVAMTGDGVNDAPAIKEADIGIAMGITGTDVTKEASDMVLTDDNFASIVNAIEEGRGIFDNVQKVVQYLLACNLGEVLLMFFSALAGWPIPLTAVQILWINLVTDGLPALALATEPPERDIMQRPPRPPREPLITRTRGLLILLYGSLIAAAALATFWLMYRGREANLPAARTAAFCVTAFSQLFFAVGCRSQRYTMPELGPFTNPNLFAAIALSGLLQIAVVSLPLSQRVFDVAAYPGRGWLLILLLALAPVTVIEVGKLIRAAMRRYPPMARYSH